MACRPAACRGGRRARPDRSWSRELQAVRPPVWSSLIMTERIVRETWACDHPRDLPGSEPRAWPPQSMRARLLRSLPTEKWSRPDRAHWRSGLWPV